MDRLYTPWRFAYVTGQIKEEGCVFCNCLQGDDEKNYLLHRAEHWYLILNRYPYNNGHLLLVLNRHESALGACTAAESAEMAQLLPVMERVLQDVYNPQGVNGGYNGGTSAGAGIPEHLHLHMLPRWQGDTGFMTTIGGSRIMPETLDETYAKLQPALRARLGEGS